VQRSWRLAAKFSVYYMLSQFGARIIIPFFSLWFYLTYQLDLTSVGYIFTASKAVETFTYLLGPPLSQRLGVVRTVVLSRMGGVLCIALLPVAPTPLVAALLFTGRNAIQRISLPLRQSYMMAVLRPEERASTAGVVQLSSTATGSLAPTLGGYLLQEVSTTLPLFISAAFFTVSNLLFYVFFGRIKPPEETRRPNE
jgi:MFS family permease